MIQYIGIDPGKSGGIAVTDGLTMTAWKMPETPHDLVAILRQLDTARVAVVERVSSSPQQGVVSAFTFGRGVGRIEAALAALRIPMHEVTPAKWQAAMGCRSKGDKNVTRAAALKLWPGGLAPWVYVACAGGPETATRITHATADACLIAEYARRLGL